jgi:hypothetical protein
LLRCFARSCEFVPFVSARSRSILTRDLLLSADARQSDDPIKARRNEEHSVPSHRVSDLHRKGEQGVLEIRRPTGCESEA